MDASHNLVDDKPCRGKQVWLKLRSGSGGWIERFPCAVLKGGHSFSALEPEAHAREHGRVGLETLLFDDVAEVELTQPPALHAAVQERVDKQNMSKLAQHTRRCLVDFLYERPDGDAVASVPVRGHRRINQEHLVLAVGYFVILCAMTALVMLAPGESSLFIGWAAVGGMGVLGALATKGAMVWLIAWMYSMLLLLLPASIMANMASTSTYWADAGGYLFIFVLWLSGWGFMWVQGRGDQHALACVRTVVWDESTNSATAAVFAAFHISMTSGIKPGKKLMKNKHNGKDNSVVAAGRVEKLSDLELGRTHRTRSQSTKKKSKEIRVASMNSHSIDAHGLPTDMLNPQAKIPDWEQSKSGEVLRWLRHRHSKLLGENGDNLDFLQFTEGERIVLKSEGDDGWCIGYREDDETTKDLLGLMVSMPSGATMKLKLWTAACAL